MKKTTIYKPLALILALLIVPLCVYAADRLVVKNDSDVVTFKVQDDGTVAIGTNTPTYPMEMQKTGINAAFVVNRTDGATNYINATAGFGNFGTVTNHPLRLVANSVWRMRINTDNSLTMSNGATCTAVGVWTNSSSRDAKENIRSLTADEALDTLGGLNPVTFNYKAEKEKEYVGFIAEDVPDLVATNDRKTLSPMDIVAVLTRVVQEQEKIITELSNDVREMKKELRLRGSVALAEVE